MNKFIPESISYEDGTQIPLKEIRRRYADSKYGKILDDQLRWKIGIREGTTPDQWRKMFGADVNNLLHLDLSHGLVRTVIRRFKGVELTQDDMEILLLTAQTHDWAEAVTGDKSFIYKNKDDEDEEVGILQAIMEEFIPEDKKSSVPKIPQVISALNDKSTLRYRIFNVVENLGYLRTSKRAYEVRDKFENEQRDSLHALACQAFMTHKPTVIDYSHEFPELAEFFLHPRSLPIWNDIQADCDKIDYEKHYPGKGKHFEKKIPEVRKMWSDFLARNGC